MKEKINKVINSKKIIIILIIVLILLIGVTSTYAWFTWSNPSNTNLTLTINNIDVIFNVSPDINITNLSPVLYPEEGASTTFSLKKNNNSLGNIEYTITLDITTISDELKSTDFKWLLKQEDTILNNGDFSTSSNNSSITLYTGTLTDTNTLSYTLYIYINGNNLNSSDMMNKSLTGTINISGEEIQVPVNLATYITNLYANAEKEVVTNNSIEYNYATSVSLMNDRIGGTTSDYDAGNIRYYGASPNNYIYFNCSDYSNQTDTTCELWRIIGVFNGKVKLIRNESIGAYSWDNKTISTGAETDYGSNDWSTARLMKLLNPSDYYTIDSNDNGYGQSLYYNGQSGTCFSGSNNATITCDFTSTGLKTSTTRNMISTETYSLLGWNSSDVYPDQIYNYETAEGSVYSGHSTSWAGKVALAYPSDYGYAADFNQCSQTLNNYSDSTCTSNNWIKNIITKNGSDYGWLLTPSSSIAYRAWNARSSGNLNSALNTSNAFGVAPVLYLNSNIELASDTGNGTEDNPYRLSV